MRRRKEWIFVHNMTPNPSEKDGKKIVILSGKTAYTTLLKDYPDIMDVSTLSRALKISEKTAYKLLSSGKITAMKVGRAYRIPKLHVLAYLKLVQTV